MRSSSSNNGPLIEILKGVNSDNGGDGEQKKNSSTKRQGSNLKATNTFRRKKSKRAGKPSKECRTTAEASSSRAATPSISTKRGREVDENKSGIHVLYVGREGPQSTMNSILASIGFGFKVVKFD
ncbi:hypothetical protein Goshw_015804 [Gossypium schwendimanii]|uniref:Uncharacterized protein n=1 Tax=Gossypium schwendimanii TaxID=34291 RepID=A0A7J9LG80_GOSSC|nr:hypothetical protein [Gossypium schwendimanii]